jgi:hypothetical protein
MIFMTVSHFAPAWSGTLANWVVRVTQAAKASSSQAAPLIAGTGRSRAQVSARPASVTAITACANGRSCANPQVRRWGFM